MIKGQKNSKKQGDIGLALAISHFAVSGYTVCVPLTDSQEYDLVVDINGKLNKIQVKTTYFKNKYGRFQVGLKVSGGNRSRTINKKFDKISCDYLFIATDNSEKYLIPTNIFDRLRSSITLGKDYDKYLIL